MDRLDYLQQPPDIYPVKKISTPEVISYLSTNDIPVYELRNRSCGVVLVELVFQAGRPQEAAKMVSSSCAALLREGSGKFTSEALSEEIDFMGATLTASASLDYITIKGVCLRRYLPRLLEIIGYVVSQPHFSEKEWLHYKQKSKERLKIQLAKTDILSYRIITESIYGSDHPYGYNSSAELYDMITADDIKEHHQNYMTSENCLIFISGDIGGEDQGLINNLCESILSGGKKAIDTVIHRASIFPGKKFISGGSNQASIRLARLACTRRHPDFDGLNFACNILGGYFGSRLITQLREIKGLTYNIYCAIDSQVYDGDIMISTEVANENVEQSLAVIYSEMDKLCNELVLSEELNLVCNYMMGNYLNLFDGPFNSIRAIKSLALAQIPLDELDTLIKSSLSFDAYQVRDMARKYFDRNDFWEVIVGTP